VITPNVTKLMVLPHDNENYAPNSNAYISINKQDKLLRLFYERTKKKLEEEIGYFDAGHTLIKARFPNYDQFKLTQGEKYFRTYFDIFGKNLSNYFNWAARNNQFVNCKLENVFRLDLEIEEDKMLKSIQDYFNLAFQDSEMFRYLSSAEQYQQLRESIFSNNVTLKLKDGTTKDLKPYGKVEFEKNIIKFIQQYNSHLPYLEDHLGINYEHYVDDIVSHKETIDTIEKLESHKKTALLNYKHYRQDDYLISTEEYIRSSMYFAKNTQLKLKNPTQDEESLIFLYSQLYDFKDTLINNYLKDKINGHLILPQDKDFKFNSKDFNYLEGLIDRLKKNDPILKNVFNFMQNGVTEKKVYSQLKKLYFEIGRTNAGSDKQSYMKRDITDDEQGKINLIYRHIDFVSLVKSYEKEYEKEYLEAKKTNIIKDKI
jgi:hypothetical protein